MLNKNVWLCFVFILVNLLVTAQSDDLQFRAVSPQGGITYGSVKTIAEDAKGFIWFGTEHGLFRYNTREMQKYIQQPDDPHSLPADNVLHIFNDQSGKLWISTFGRLCFFDEENQNFVSLNLK